MTMPAAVIDNDQVLIVGKGVIVGHIERLARALTVQEAALALVWKLGWAVFAAEAGAVPRDDPEDPMRTAIRQVMGVFAELDRRYVTERPRDGRRAKAATGREGRRGLWVWERRGREGA